MTPPSSLPLERVYSARARGARSVSFVVIGYFRCDDTPVLRALNVCPIILMLPKRVSLFFYTYLSIVCNWQHAHKHVSTRMCARVGGLRIERVPGTRCTRSHPPVGQPILVLFFIAGNHRGYCYSTHNIRDYSLVVVHWTKWFLIESLRMSLNIFVAKKVLTLVEEGRERGVGRLWRHQKMIFRSPFFFIEEERFRASFRVIPFDIPCA